MRILFIQDHGLVKNGDGKLERDLREPSGWVAVGMDYYCVADGETPQEAEANYLQLLQNHLKLQELNLLTDALRPAPERYQKLWDKAPDLRFSNLRYPEPSVEYKLCPLMYLNGFSCAMCLKNSPDWSPPPGWHNGYSSDGLKATPCQRCGHEPPASMTYEEFEKLYGRL